MILTILLFSYEQNEQIHDYYIVLKTHNYYLIITVTVFYLITLDNGTLKTEYTAVLLRFNKLKESLFDPDLKCKGQP